MPKAAVNDIEIEYETYGDPGGEPILLIHGLGAQLTRWTDAFTEALVDRGFYVIVYDNRDVGLSTKFSDWGPADIPAAFAQARAKQPVDAPYKLEDMAADAAGLLTCLGITRAHILGSSNGGAIAQLFAILYPQYTASLVSVMATSGRRGLPRATEEADAWLAKPKNPDGTREAAMEEAVESARLLGSPGFPRDEVEIRELAARDFDRAFYPEGNSRHLLASIASGDTRVPRLAEITAPTLVIHGVDDPLVRLGCAEDVRDSIPGAEMLVIEGMGHDFPDAAAPRIADAILANARRNPVRD
jgi:pimeloyl-ACP methyl ester carboxylesterase